MNKPGHAGHRERLRQAFLAGEEKARSDGAILELILHINLFYSKEDDGYIADIPDLTHCSAFGSTPKEALHEVFVAKEAWLEVAREAGKPIPAPRYRPIIDQRVR
jgi:predicted RNase H-like HicB family nuclease